MIGYNMAMRRVLLLSLVLLVVLPETGWSWYPRLAAESRIPQTPDGVVVGRNRLYLTGPGETLIDIARRSRLGFRALVNANPGVDPWSPEIGSELLLPYATILPEELQVGITVNLAEFRLYLCWEEEGQRRVRIYPVGLGQQGWMTPEGDFHVTVVIDNPLWTVPQALRAERPDQPALVEAGPDNPLGSHWIGLSVDGYGIHGTNRPYGIGRQVSHGCIRLYPADILDLVEKVGNGTPVKIIYRPIKLAREGNRLLLEVHGDFLGNVTAPRDMIQQRVTELGWQQNLDEEAIEQALRETRGIPVQIAGSE